jgi:hypothetical protein
VKSETIEYRDGDLTLKGFVAFDDSKAASTIQWEVTCCVGVTLLSRGAATRLTP